MKESRHAAYERRQREKGATLVALRLDKETASLLDWAAKIHGSKTAALKAALEKTMSEKYSIRPENMTTEVKWKTAATLTEARETARYAISSAMGEPARAGIYRLGEEEAIEIWEDGKKVWKSK